MRRVISLAVGMFCVSLLFGVLLFHLLKPHSRSGLVHHASQGPRPHLDAKFHLTNKLVAEELKTVIEGQLAAFYSDDYSTAFSYAATGFQKVSNPQAFEQMVKVGYPLIASPVSIEYGSITDNGAEAHAQVTIRSTQNKKGEFLYLLRRESSTWKVDGVLELPSIQIRL